jgi:hypothetical protein
MAIRAVERFFRLPPADRRLLVRSLLLLAATRVALWMLPFQTVRRLLARTARPTAAARTPTERISWAIGVAQRVIPSATCLPQALVGEALLTRAGHPFELRIGVAKTAAGGLHAHAWIESDGRVVVGELVQGLSEFTRLPPLPGAQS